jgi:tRNA pseudouridine38-40 synthase
VYSLSIERVGGIIELRISADGFLYNMVRIIAGTLIDCACGVFEPGEIRDIIASHDRTRAGRTAPPDGLYLADVRYGCSINWKIF